MRVFSWLPLPLLSINFAALFLLFIYASKASSYSLECGAIGQDGIAYFTEEAVTMHKFAATIVAPSNGTSAWVKPRMNYVFLLGYAFSGTSALHFLLGTSPQVSTLRDPELLEAKKEGWAVDGLKSRMKRRWNVTDEAIPWARLQKTYTRNWNLTKPFLLENSPPEIEHASALFKQFKGSGEVRFVVLVRSPCNQHLVAANVQFERLRTVRRIIEKFGRKVFVVRYEDLCFSTMQVQSNDKLLRHHLYHTCVINEMKMFHTAPCFPTLILTIVLMK